MWHGRIYVKEEEKIPRQTDEPQGRAERAVFWGWGQSIDLVDLLLGVFD